MICHLLRVARSALDLPLTAAEAGAGLVPPAAATYLLGDGGSILIILVSALVGRSVAPGCRSTHLSRVPYKDDCNNNRCCVRRNVGWRNPPGRLLSDDGPVCSRPQMLFMAVTSSGSAELIAVSSLFTYDVRCSILCMGHCVGANDMSEHTMTACISYDAHLLADAVDIERAT